MGFDGGYGDVGCAGVEEEVEGEVVDCAVDFAYIGFAGEGYFFSA